MKRKPELQVYTLKDTKTIGKPRKIVKVESFLDTHLEDHAPSFVSHNIDGENDEMHKFLQTNPFLYKGQYSISSIEEFYIDVKKNKVPFGSAIRSKDIKRNRKKKIILKAFKDWKKDFENQKNAIFNKENDQLVVIGEVYSERFSITTYLALTLLLLLISIITFKIGDMWPILGNKSFFSKINYGVADAFSHKWVNILATLTIYQIFITFFYSFFHNYLIRDFINTNIGTNSMYKKSCKILEKDFKRKYKYSRKYYLKQNWKNPLKVPPLSIEKTAIGEVDLDKIKELIDEFVRKSASLKRKKALLMTFRFLTIFFSYGGGLVVIGYNLYSIIIKIL